MRATTIGLAVLFAGSCRPDAPTVHVAAVGDSITFGHGIEPRGTGSYPAQLEARLGSGWEVRNFGHNAATVINDGDEPYTATPEYRAALQYDAEVVVIMLGTNDSKPRNWKHQDSFEADYLELIDTFAALPSEPHIWLALPVPAYGDAWGIQPAVIDDEILGRVREVARKRGLKVIDAHSPLKDHPEWFPDTIHPTRQGAAAIAKIVHAALTAD